MKLKQMFMPLTGLALISLASPIYAGDNGEQYTRTFTVNAVGFLDPMPVFAEVPTMGVVRLTACHTSPSYGMWINVVSFDDAQPFFVVGTVTGSDLPAGVNPGGVVSDQSAGALQSGGGTLLIAKDGDPTFGTAGHWEWSLWREDGDNTPGAHVSIDGWNDPTSGKCYFRATVLQND
jgi:hypothetical protein